MINSKIYSELHALLYSLGEEFTSKIPTNLLELIDNEKDPNYIPDIDESKPIDEQNLDEITMVFVTLFKLEYWCKSVEEKKDILTSLESNSKESETMESLVEIKKLLESINSNSLDQ
jgi:hypothetical protein